MGYKSTSLINTLKVSLLNFKSKFYLDVINFYYIWLLELCLSVIWCTSIHKRAST